MTCLFSGPRYRQPVAEGEIHALIVAGSNGWYNYRHQVSWHFHDTRDFQVTAAWDSMYFSIWTKVWIKQ